MSTIQDLQQVQARRQEILDGDAARVEKQKKSGKLTARERVAKLLDDKSFVELDVLVSHDGKAEGVVTGYGTVEGRPVYVLSQDYTVLGGSVGEKHARKIAKVLDLARKTGSPVVLMCDSAGARIDEGATALEAYADIFARMARMSGVTPMIAMVLGPCVGAAALMSEMSDLTVMVKGVGAKLCAGPQVVSAVNGVNKTAEELGGAQAMLQQGGADFACESEQEAFETVRKALALLPSNNMEDAPLEAAEELNRACVGLEAGVDAKTLLAQLCDAGSVLELGAGYTKAVTALARMGGRAVALVHTGGGEICAKRAQKIARFVRFADCYNLPVVTLIDTEGLSVPKENAQSWQLKATGQMLFAYAEATTAKLAVVTGKAIGAAYVALGGRANADVVYAWPGSVIAPMTGEAAATVLCSEELRTSKGDPKEARAEIAARYEAEVADGVNAAMSGCVDDVVDPAQTRKLLIASLEMLASKRDSNPPKKHGNMPL